MTLDIASNSYAVNTVGLIKLDLGKAIKISDAPEDIYQNAIRASESMLEAKYTTPPDTSSNPSYKTYATIEVQGKGVATIDNHGFVSSSNQVGSLIGNLLPGSVNGQEGPVLAQTRAEIIAKALNGKIVKSPTAQTQSQFDATPQPTVSIDYKAMQNDAMYAQLQATKTARTLFLAQQMS